MKKTTTTLCIFSLCLPSVSVAVVGVNGQNKSEEIQTLGSDFSAGYKAGYKKANPLGISPIPPIPPIGKDTYGDGYGMGYARGLADKG